MRCARKIFSKPEAIVTNENAAEVQASESRQNFAFVMNLARLTDADSYVLAPGCELRRARDHEIEVIKKNVDTLGPYPHKMAAGQLWECRLPETGSSQELLPKREWRYFVISFTGSNSPIVNLERAFLLARSEIEIGFTAVFEKPGAGTIWIPGRLFQFFDAINFARPSFIELSLDDVKEIELLHNQLLEHDSKLLDTQRLVLQLHDLKALPHHFPLCFLGYFAILESVLTHTPNPEDRYDSITRQVKKKLALLNERFIHKLPYSPYFAAQTPRRYGERCTSTGAWSRTATSPILRAQN